MLDILKELLIVGVALPEKLAQAFAEPLIGLVAEVLLVPSDSVDIVSVPAMIYPYELCTETHTYFGLYLVFVQSETKNLNAEVVGACSTVPA